MAKMFRERNPIPIGLIAVTCLAVLVLGILNVDRIVGTFGRHYSAAVPEAAGLRSGSPVRVAGLKVGRVNSVELASKGVLVEFTVTDSDIEIGNLTTAAIQVDTVLGDKALVLTSHGDKEMAEGATIPFDRTTSPYDVSSALADLTDEAEGIDVPRVAEALDVVSETLNGSAPELRAALTGVSRLSETIGSRDAELRSLLDHAEGFSAVLADRGEQMATLVEDGNKLLQVLVDRRDTIAALLVNISAMATQLSGLVDDNKAQIRPTLRQLNGVVDILRANKVQLEGAITGLAGYATTLGEAVGSGNFFTAIIQNLMPGNLLPPTLGGSPRTDGGQ